MGGAWCWVLRFDLSTQLSALFCYDFRGPMDILKSAFAFKSLSAAMPLAFAAVLLVILIISFRSRAVVFCQYLEAMTGIALHPKDVRRAYREGGKEGVRTLFLDLIIREDLKEGPMEIPDSPDPAHDKGMTA